MKIFYSLRFLCFYLLLLFAQFASAASAGSQLKNFDFRWNVLWMNYQLLTPIVIHHNTLRGDAQTDVYIYHDQILIAQNSYISTSQEQQECLLVPGLGSGSITIEVVINSNQVYKDSIWSPIGSKEEDQWLAIGMNTDYNYESFKNAPLASAPKSSSRKTTKHRSSTQGQAVAIEQIEYPTEYLPRKWQAYPQDLGLILSERNLQELDAQQKQAISIWAKQGGELLLCNKEALKDWPQLNNINYLPPEIKTARNVLLSRINNTRNKPTISTFHLQHVNRVPFAIFAIVIITYVILAGPVILYITRKKKNLLMTLYIVPLLSCICFILLGITGLFSNGLGTKGRQIHLSWLDCQQEEAFFYNANTYYAPFGLGNFSYPSNGVLYRYNENYNRHSYYYYNRYNSESLLRGINWQGSPIAQDVWIDARTEQHLAEIQYRPSKQRIIVRKKADGLYLLNGLEQNIEYITYKDDNAKIYTAINIDIGQEKRLETGLDLKQEYLGTFSHFTLPPGAQRLWKTYKLDTPHSFQAKISAPLYPSIMPTIDDHDQSISVLTGIAQTGTLP